eukprot:TRINITY_DN111061_c0_g1_i1.p1 TRINITY_DN111061_c0_g1~~TRINITY_DN111061_c0_g1_i1.p1  ORF type:complete len:160 (-),score=49.92 TRINITY_DN111061_c0_g1_i1:115-594(-)
MEDVDTSKWNVLYPHYINSKLTYSEGRRISTAKAVPNPVAPEMAQVCEFLKLPYKLEMNKSYPRDWMIRGRIRVMLKTPEGKFTHPEVQSKQQLMLKMGELIPTLKNRQNNPEGHPHPKEACALADKQVSAGSSSAPASKAEKKEAKKQEKKAEKKGKK